MIKVDPYTMTTGDVARVLGVTDETVRQYDEELQPVRRPNGRRYYRPADVERVANARARIAGRIPPLTTR
jgi:DNA-binding transcriptional MerR regulator